MSGVRLARLTDLTPICAWGKDRLAATNYHEFEFNGVIARRTLKGCMTSKDSRVWVAERKDMLCGLLVGEIGPMPFTHYMSATDLIFAAEAHGSELLSAFIAWCKLRGVARIDMGVSAGALEREPALRRVFEREGMVYSGPMFHMNLLGEAA